MNMAVTTTTIMVTTTMLLQTEVSSDVQGVAGQLYAALFYGRGLSW